MIEIGPKMQKAILLTGPLKGSVQWGHWRIQRGHSMTPFNGPARLAQNRLELFFEHVRIKVGVPNLTALSSSGRILRYLLLGATLQSRMFSDDRQALPDRIPRGSRR